MAFLDMGDQFLALAAHAEREPDASRHFGLVVDDIEVARAAVEREGLEIVGSRGLTFLDPWGNQVQVVDYRRSSSSEPTALSASWGSRVSRRAMTPAPRSRSAA